MTVTTEGSTTLARTKSTVPKERINLFITPEAAQLLMQLAPSENKRGEYVEGLIHRAAQEAGVGTAHAGTGDVLNLASLQLQLQAAQRQLQQVQTHYEDLLSRVATALERQQPSS